VGEVRFRCVRDAGPESFPPALVHTEAPPAQPGAFWAEYSTHVPSCEAALHNVDGWESECGVTGKDVRAKKIPHPRPLDHTKKERRARNRRIMFRILIRTLLAIVSILSAKPWHIVHEKIRMERESLASAPPFTSRDFCFSPRCAPALMACWLVSAQQDLAGFVIRGRPKRLASFFASKATPALFIPIAFEHPQGSQGLFAILIYPRILHDLINFPDDMSDESYQIPRYFRIGLESKI